MPTLLHEWMNNYMDNNIKRSLHCSLAVHSICTIFVQLYKLCGHVLGRPHSQGCVCGCCSRPVASRWPLPLTLIHSSPSASLELCWVLKGTQYSQDKEEDTDSLHPHLQAELLNILQLHPIYLYHLVRRRKCSNGKTWKNVFFSGFHITQKCDMITLLGGFTETTIPSSGVCSRFITNTFYK